MNKLVIACIIFTAIVSGCSNSTAVTTNATNSTTTKTSAKPSTATVGWATISSATPTTTIPTMEPDPFTITRSAYSLKAQEEQFWTYNYTVTVQNNTSHELEINLIIQYLDDDNYELAVEHLLDVALPASGTRTITGTTKIAADLAANVFTMSVGFN